jgi:hypothetical protein
MCLNIQNNFRGGAAMLREIEGVAEEPRTHRRWFHDDYFDLFVWQTDTGDVTLFQLCYGTAPAECALVWHREGGFFHDGGEPAGPPNGEVAQRFESAAKALPRKVRNAVGGRIREYIEGRLPAAARRSQFRREEWQKQPQG